MLERGKLDRDLVEFVVIDQLVPKEHLLDFFDRLTRVRETHPRIPEKET